MRTPLSTAATAITEITRPDIPALVSRVKAGGQILLSGLLVEQEAALTQELDHLGLRVRSRREAEGWVALQTRRK